MWCSSCTSQVTVSFGSTTSLISLPCFMSHASIPADVRAARGLPDDLVRISAGIEDEKDLIADLEQRIQHPPIATHRSLHRCSPFVAAPVGAVHDTPHNHIQSVGPTWPILHLLQDSNLVCRVGSLCVGDINELCEVEQHVS